MSLSPEEIRKLDQLSTPTLPFTAALAALAPGFAYAGATLNGTGALWVPQKGGARY